MSIDKRIESLMARLTVKLMPALADLVLAFCHDCGNTVTNAAGFLQLVCEYQALDMPPQQLVNRAYRSIRFSVQAIRDLQELLWLYHDAVKYSSWNSLVTPATIQGVLTDAFSSIAHEYRASLLLEHETIREDFLLPATLLRAFVVPLVINSLQAHQATGEQSGLKILVRVEYAEGPPRLHIVVEDDGPGWQGQLARLQMSVDYQVDFRRQGIQATDGIPPLKGQSLAHLASIVKHLDGELLLWDNAPRGAKVEIFIPWENVSEPLD